MRQVIDKSFAGKNVLIMGLGSFGGGVGVTRFMVQEGATVTVTDNNPANKLQDSLAQLGQLPIEYHLGGHQESDFIRAEVIVVNPAVPGNSPWLDLARQHKAIITSEMNIFFARCRARIIGVTGSNGKSTTTAMTAFVLQQSRQSHNHLPYNRVWMGGNIGGENLLCRVDQIDPDDLVVLELSSFQLEDLARLQQSPHVAIVTNITPNHLDRHGTMEEYIKAKQNILRFQQPGDWALLNRCCPEFQNWQKLVKGSLVWYPADDLAQLELQVPGMHNRFNAAAALAAAELFGVENKIARPILKNYTALPHRLELVRLLDTVRYYNDSIATTPESTIAAIESFTEEKVFILGGYDKKIPFDEMVEKIVPNVAVVILLGAVREKLAELIEKVKTRKNQSRPFCVKAGDLAEAVALAKKLAPPSSVVLLSPACASYDMFKNFQERGRLFKQLVQAL